MQTGPSHSGEMSHDSEQAPLHRSHVEPTAPVSPASPGPASSSPVPLSPAIDPAARTSRGLYEGLSASSAGLELGIAVGLGALFGSWLDGKLGTEPWMLLVFLIVGVAAGFRGVLRAVARAERAERRG